MGEQGFGRIKPSAIHRRARSKVERLRHASHNIVSHRAKEVDFLVPNGRHVQVHAVQANAYQDDRAAGLVQRRALFSVAAMPTTSKTMSNPPISIRLLPRPVYISPPVRRAASA